MQIFTQRIMLLTALVMVFATKLFAQASYYVEPRLIVNTPSGLAGPKQFNWSQNPTNTTPWGRPIDSVYYNVPVEKAYDSLGINPLLNGTGGYPSLQGKFALILRGHGISFSQKADYCQRAGAIGVIIVNHKNGGTIGMAPTAPFSTNTTIPVLIISMEDGMPLNEAIKNNQPVSISLGNWGFKHSNDLGLVSFSPAMPHAHAMPISQVNANAGTPRAFNFYNGSHVANFGTADQTNVKLRQVLSFTPTGGSATALYADSVISASFPTADSVQEFFSNNVKKLTFPGTGVLDMTYTVSSNAVDQNPFDNIANHQVYITDSIYCKSRWNAQRNMPHVSSSVRYSAAQPLIWGPLFYVTKGGYKIDKAQFAITADSDLLNNNPIAPAAQVYVFKWTDANNDGLVNGPELGVVAYGSKSTFTNTDSSGKPFMVNLINAKNVRLVPRVEDNSWYMLAAEVENDFAIGADNESNFYTRNYLSIHADSNANSRAEYWAPNFTARLAGPNYLVSDDTLSNISFFSKSITKAENVVFNGLTGLVPSMALHLSKNIPTSIETTPAKVFNQFEIYPVPTNEQLNVKLDMIETSNVVISVMNTAAQSVAFMHKPSFKSGVVTINTSAYPAGTYYLIIGTDKGTESRPFTIVK